MLVEKLELTKKVDEGPFPIYCGFEEPEVLMFVEERWWFLKLIKPIINRLKVIVYLKCVPAC